MSELKGEICCFRKWKSFGHTYTCTAQAKVERDGKPYCLRHDPVKKAEKRQARDAKWKEEVETTRRLREKAARLAACERAVVEAAEKRYRAWKRLHACLMNDGCGQGVEFDFNCAVDEEDEAVAAYLEARGA